LSAGLSIREFARREGCNDKLVRRAIQYGRLATLEDGSLDEALVGTGWRKSNRRAADTASADTADKPADTQRADTADIPAAAGPADIPDLALEDLLSGRGSMAQAELAKMQALAARQQIAARKAAGELVDADLAERVLFEEARRYRDAWVNWPSKVGPLIAADLGLTPEAVLEVLSRHVHQQLEELGEPDGEFAGGETS
jgi:hypothetical protein